jgi:hypothetical protein
MDKCVWCKLMVAIFNAINLAMTLGFTTWEANVESVTLTSDAFNYILKSCIQYNIDQRHTFNV